MALNFPDSPTLNQEYAAGSRLWRWNGTRWISASGVLYNSQINDISDVSITSVANGDFLRYNGSASAWINDPVNLGTDTTGNYVADVIGGTGITVSHTPGEGSSASVALNATLDDLSNVDAASPSDGQFLKYVSASTAWVPANIPTINNLDDVGDVTAPTPSSGDFLKWNGTAWVNDPINLGTDTTGNYMSEVTAGTGITISHTQGEGSSASISVTSNTYQPINSTLTILGTVSPDSNLLPYFTSNGSASTTPITYSARTILDDSSYSAMRDTMGIGTGNTVTFAGATLGFTRVGVAAAGEIDTVAGDLTIDSAGGTTTIDDNLIISGNLTVNGTTTTLNTDTLSVEDNIIILNSNVSGSPVLNAGIEVERGTSTNVAVRWNETSNKWELTNDGAAYEDIATEGYVNGLTYSLDDLTDVESATPADGQFLKYVSASSAWVPANIPTINNLDDIGDVVITSASASQVLQYNGTNWVNVTQDISALTVSASSPGTPSEGDLWFDSDTAQTFVYYDGQWIEIGASAMGATVSTTAPNSPIGGQVWFNSDTGGTYVYYESNWIEIGAAPANAILQAIDAKGDLIVGTADNTVDNLTVGSNNQILMADSSTATGLKWAKSPETDLITTKGDLLVGTAADTLARQGVGANGSILMADSSQTNGVTWSTAQTSGRNCIINGDFKVWQRGTAVQANAGQGAYAADRWCGSHQFQNSRTQRTTISSPPSGLLSQYALRSSSSTTAQVANGTRMRIAQKVESLNSYRFRGQQVTLSFWVRFSNATVSSVSNSGGGGDSSYGAFSYSIGSYTSTTDSATNTSAADSSTSATISNGSLPTTWTKYTLTGTISSTANNIDVVFGFTSLGSTASADTEWFELAQIQLEDGAVATPFEFEDYGKTLVKCQRYYQRISPALAYGAFGGFGAAGSTTGADFDIPLPVQMRVTPTALDVSGANHFAGSTSNVLYASTGIAIQGATASRSVMSVTLSGMSTTAGLSMRLLANNNSSAYLGFTAEL